MFVRLKTKKGVYIFTEEEINTALDRENEGVSSEVLDENDDKIFCIMCGKIKEDYEAGYCDECWGKEQKIINN